MLLLPILIALVARVALAPLQHWVVVGSRAGAVPVAVSIAGPGGSPRGRRLRPAGWDRHARKPRAPPRPGAPGRGERRPGRRRGALGDERAGDASLPGHGAGQPRGGWLRDAGRSRCECRLGGAGKRRARADPAWPGLDVGDSRLAGYRAGAALVPADRLAERGRHHPRQPRAVSAPAIRHLRRADHASEQSRPRRDELGLLAALLTVLATFFVAVGALRLPLAMFRSEPAESPEAVDATEEPRRKAKRQRVRRASLAGTTLPRAIDDLGEVALTLVVLIGLNILVGIVPLSWLAGLTGASLAASDPTLATAFTILVGILVFVAVRSVDAPAALVGRLPLKTTRGVRAVLQRYHPERVVDPYLTFGFLLLLLGRLSATILDNTLGRLARAG